MRFLLVLIFFIPLTAFADGPPAVDPADAPPSGHIEASPKQGWNESAIASKGEEEWWETALLYIPNRVVDLVDIFRADVGVGGSFGGVLRVTEKGQAGYRSLGVGSARVGLFGREVPIMIEKDDEKGIGPSFKQSRDRHVCQGEVGIGVDAVAGAYAGICFDEVVDFLGGVFLLDPSNDDF